MINHFLPISNSLNFAQIGLGTSLACAPNIMTITPMRVKYFVTFCCEKIGRKSASSRGTIEIISRVKLHNAGFER